MKAIATPIMQRPGQAPTRNDARPKGIAITPPPSGISFIDQMAEQARRTGQPGQPQPGVAAIRVARFEALQEMADAWTSRRSVAQLAALAARYSTPRQRATPEQEEPVQGRLDTARRAAREEEDGPLPGCCEADQRQAEAPNRTGLPDRLKAGVERLAGLSMDSVRVHYNSSQPAQLNALAYTQGAAIHVGPGQERHLAHEAWHVVQQAQGRVRATTQMKGVGINDDPGLETEADRMGAKAVHGEQAAQKGAAPYYAGPFLRNLSLPPFVQRIELDQFEKINADALLKKRGDAWPGGNADDMIAWAKSWKQIVTFINQYTRSDWSEIQKLFPSGQALDTKKETIDFKVLGERARIDLLTPLNGRILKQSAINRRILLIPGMQLHNQEVRQELSAVDPDMSHWGKFATLTYYSETGNPNDDYAVHFYYNTFINLVCTTKDYKKVFRDQSFQSI